MLVMMKEEVVLMLCLFCVRKVCVCQSYLLIQVEIISEKQNKYKLLHFYISTRKGFIILSRSLARHRSIIRS